MNINIKFEALDFEKYFRVSFIAHFCLCILFMILLLNISFSFLSFLGCLFLGGVSAGSYLISRKMYEQIRVFEQKAYYFDELEKRNQEKENLKPVLIPEPEVTPKFDIEKVSQDPEIKADYLTEVKRNGEIIDLEL